MLFRVSVISLFTLLIFSQPAPCQESGSSAANKTTTNITLKNGTKFYGEIISEDSLYMVLDVKGNNIRIMKTLITTRNDGEEKSTKSVPQGMQTHIVCTNGSSYTGKVISEDNLQISLIVNDKSISIQKSSIIKRKTERNLFADTAEPMKAVHTAQSPKVYMASPTIPKSTKPALSPGDYSLVKQHGLLPTHSSPPPENDGKKQLAIGGLLMALSVTNIGYIAIRFPIDWNAGRRNQNYSASALIGLGSFISGIIMLVKGGRYRTEYREWKQSKSQ